MMHRITTLRIEITDRCPLACAHCSVNAGPGKSRMLPTPEGRSLIRAFAELGGEELVLTGGEPLVHPDCVVLVRVGKASGLVTTLFSMGVAEGMRVVDRAILTELASALDVWRVSLHASAADRHDRLTRMPGSFNATCQAVPLIVSAGIEVRATFFAYPENIADLAAVAALCSKLGVAELRVLTLVPQGRGAALSKGFSIEREEIESAVKQASAQGGVRVRLGEATRARQGDDSDCRAIQEELVVNWDGWISPCHSVEPAPSDSDFDNVLRVGLEEALEMSPRLRRCREVALLHPCGCSGGCLASRALPGAG